MIADMRITIIDMTDIFSNANCQYHFGIITLDISYHPPISILPKILTPTQS